MNKNQKQPIYTRRELTLLNLEGELREVIKLLQGYVDEKYSSQNLFLEVNSYDGSYDSLVLENVRLETDKEFSDRRKAEQEYAAAENKKKAALRKKRSEAEFKTYLQLKKKYEKTA